MDRFCPHSTPLECGSFNERFSIDIALRWSAETYLSAKKATNTLHPQLKYLHDIKDFRKNLKVFLFITSLNITDQNTLFIRHLFNANSDNWRRYCCSVHKIYYPVHFLNKFSIFLQINHRNKWFFAYFRSGIIFAKRLLYLKNCRAPEKEETIMTTNIQRFFIFFIGLLFLSTWMWFWGRQYPTICRHIIWTQAVFTCKNWDFLRTESFTYSHSEMCLCWMPRRRRSWRPWLQYIPNFHKGWRRRTCIHPRECSIERYYRRNHFGQNASWWSPVEWCGNSALH